MTITLAAAAKVWQDAGFGPIATMPGEKRPNGAWRQYQQEPAPLTTVITMLNTGCRLGLVLLPGQEAIDVEGRAVQDGTWQQVLDAAHEAGMAGLLARVMGGYHETSPSGGIHILWRCEAVEGNQKLASRPRDGGEDALIETRGPGGFLVVAPSSDYQRLAGAPASVVTITPEERDDLLSLFRAHDERHPPQDTPADLFSGPAANEDGLRPGDDYNTRATWDEVLEPTGWVKVQQGGRGETWWRRPGKERGWSATTGATANDTLHVHSTSTPFDPSPVSYSKFSAYALMCHGGDHHAAAKELVRLGYGDQPVAVDSHGVRTVEPERYTDLGNARRLVAEHGHKLRHVPAWERWYTWDGKRWAVDDTGEAHRCAKTMAHNLVDEATAEPDEDKRKKLVSAARRAESWPGIRAMLALAATEPGIALAPSQLDAHPTLLNTRTGVLDLDTGQVREHDPTLHLTKITGAGYDAQAAAPEFAKFLERVQPDPDMRAFLARLLGHTLTGRVTEHLMAILHGVGANGKSTLTELVRHALGDYAGTTDPGLLIDRGDVHPTGIADLFGLRLAITHETDSGRRLAEGTIKRLTGGDRIKARRMRENFWEFDPTHSIIMVTNHQPIVNGDDEGIWRRLRMVPWPVVIPLAERDGKLPERLITEIDGVLSWLVTGYQEYRSRGLAEPGAVTTATAAYRAESDALGRFLEERCILAAGFRTRSAELFAAWSGWCAGEGVAAGTQKAFSTNLTNRGYDKSIGGGRVVWHGIGIVSDSDGE
jgi:putative DNA primase/helicase